MSHPSVRGLTPPDSAPAAPPHPRGVVEGTHTFDGLRSFRFFDCTGRMVIFNQMDAEWVSPELIRRFEEFMDDVCPPHIPHDASYHADALRPQPSLKLEG